MKLAIRTATKGSVFLSSDGQKENVEAILTRASDVLREHGWIQDQIGEVGQGFCAIGAITYAYTEGKDIPYRYTDAVADTRAQLLLTIKNEMSNDEMSYSFSIPTWNDKYASSLEDVLLMFKKAKFSLYD